MKVLARHVKISLWTKFVYFSFKLHINPRVGLGYFIFRLNPFLLWLFYCLPYFRYLLGRGSQYLGFTVMRMSNNFFLARSLLQEDIKAYKISKLRHCVSAGEPVNEEVSQLYRICYLNLNFNT